MFMEDGGVRVVSGEEDHIFERMSAVIWSDEWVQLPGLKVRDQRSESC